LSKRASVGGAQSFDLRTGLWPFGSDEEEKIFRLSVQGQNLQMQRHQGHLKPSRTKHIFEKELLA
jgi:hypothetical protein